MGGQARQGRRGEVVKEGEERCVREGEVCVRQERRGMGGKGGDERVAVDRCEKERKREEGSAVGSITRVACSCRWKQS